MTQAPAVRRLLAATAVGGATVVAVLPAAAWNARDGFAHIAREHDRFHGSLVIYDDRGTGAALYYPNGWMEDDGGPPWDLWVDDDHEAARSGLTALHVRYEPGPGKRDGWAGVYWQVPDGNWGTDAGRDLRAYGPLTLTFWARGGKGGELVRFFSGGLNRSRSATNPHQDSYGPVHASGALAGGSLRLRSAWERYDIDLSRENLTEVIGAFGFVVEQDLNPHGATVLLDDVAFIPGAAGLARRAREPRFARSYVPTGIGEPDSRFSNTCFTYDNALAILAGIAIGTDASIARARLIGSAMVAAQRHDRVFADGRLRNAYAAGDLLDTARHARIPGFWDADSLAWQEDGYAVGTDCGNMAWAIIALVSLASVSHPDTAGCLAAAACLGDWVERNARSDCRRGGYAGGVTGWAAKGQRPSRWQSTEHNIDLYVAFERLAKALPGSAATYRERSRHAWEFVDAMWSEDRDHLWTGTQPSGCAADTTYRTIVPLDVHAWAVLARDDPPELAAGLEWCRETCWVEEGGGYDFKARTDRVPPGVWWEGTAQMALAWKQVHNRHRADEALRSLKERGVGPGGGVFACAGDSLQTGLGWTYYRREHLGATAWAVFADLGWNPYWGRPVGGR